MPKAGSGFLNEARRNADRLQRGGKQEWQLSGAKSYTAEIQSLYKDMYRNGVEILRDSRGKFKDFGGSEEALNNALDRIQDIATRMGDDLRMYDPASAETYKNMRRVWGKAVRVSPQEMREFRAGMQHGDKMLINPRGGRTASDAENRASEGKWYTDKNTNTDILLDVNRQLNSVRNSIWRSPTQGEKEYYTSEIYSSILEYYQKTERYAWKKRRRK